MTNRYWGYIYSDERQVNQSPLDNEEQLVGFLKSHLYYEQLVITDARDNLVFHSRDGVDLYSNLTELGIDLPTIYQELHQELYAEGELETSDREPWEETYDRFGLSPGEIKMRQGVKRACKAARTVEGVAELLKGTYFDAFFLAKDRKRAWGYLDVEIYTVYILDGSEEEGWANERDELVNLDLSARVKHISSSEDQHWFLILDPPD